MSSLRHPVHISPNAKLKPTTISHVLPGQLVAVPPGFAPPPNNPPFVWKVGIEKSTGFVIWARNDSDWIVLPGQPQPPPAAPQQKTHALRTKNEQRPTPQTTSTSTIPPGGQAQQLPGAATSIARKRPTGEITPYVRERERTNQFTLPYSVGRWPENVPVPPCYAITGKNEAYPGTVIITHRLVPADRLMLDKSETIRAITGDQDPCLTKFIGEKLSTLKHVAQLV